MASNQMEKWERDLATADNMTEYAKMIMQPYANWGNYLTPVPMSIAMLGELVFISAKKDFSINKNPPLGGYKYIRHPKSFRASLMQVCNSGYDAFKEAHSSMNQIRMHTANMPRYVGDAVEIILMDDIEAITIILPDVLETVENIAKSCLSLAQSTRDHFEAVVNLIHELIEVMLSAKGAYDQDLTNVIKTIEEYKHLQEINNEEQKRTEKELKDSKEQWEAAGQKLGKSIEDMPSGWDIIGMNVVEGILNVITFQSNTTKQSASMLASENARIKIIEFRMAMDKASANYKESFNRAEKERKEMKDILSTLASADIQKIDFNTTLKFLALGLRGLGQVKGQWEKLSQFFEMVLNINKASMNICMDGFVKKVGMVKKLREGGQIKREIIDKQLEKVYDHALQVSTLAKLVKMLSTTYVTVSGQHIMGQISSLGILMALPVDAPNFEEERKNLQNGVKSAEDAILKLIEKNMLEFQRKAEGHSKELNGLLLLTNEEKEKGIEPMKSEL